ncbi:MAG: CpaF family protein [Nitrospinota bacterium]
MSLANRLNGGESTTPLPGNQSKDSFELKTRVHRILIERLDLSKLATVEREKLEGEFRKEIARLIHELKPGIGRAEEDRMVREVLDEVFGLGPIEPLLHDPDIEEIMVNNCRQVFCAREGKIFLTDTIFKDDDHLRHIIDRIVSQVGRRIDESSPMVDARLLDGSRVNAIIPPLALDGPCLTIRRFPKDRLTAIDLMAFGTMNRQMGDLLKACVEARLNILVSGGTGSGKTTLLNVLSGFIPARDRIITIEDSAELQLQQTHVVRLETRPDNLEGRGGVTSRDLLRNCLRMRPDRIVVGEVRGGEALDMLQAMNTGHDGSISTVHANSPRDALSRVEMMIAIAGVEVPLRALRQQMASSIDLLVHLSRLEDGSRKITNITEISGTEGDMITMEDIYIFREEGRTEDGKIKGTHSPTGVRPRFFDRFEALGLGNGFTMEFFDQEAV